MTPQNTLVPVPFHNETVYYIEKDGEQYIPVKPIVENLGLNWEPQHRKLVSAQNRWSMIMMIIVAADGKNRDMVCIPLRKLASFLASINPDKVREDLREKLIQYQNECDEVLYKYWTSRKPEHQHSEDTEHEYSLKEQLEGVRFILETHHITGDPLTLALDQYYQSETGKPALKASGIRVIPEVQEMLLTPTMIGERLTPKQSASEVNKLLEKMGFQQSVTLSDGKKKRWESMPEVRGTYAIIELVKKRANKGTPIEQTKWRESVVALVQAALDKSLDTNSAQK